MTHHHLHNLGVVEGVDNMEYCEHDLVGRIGGMGDVWLRDPDGSRKLIGRFHNVVTDQARERILRSILQTSAGDKLSATSYMKKVAVCSGTIPADPAVDPIADVEGYVDVGALANITSTSSSASGTVSASWENAGGAPVTIKYIAMCYAESTAASNIYAVLRISDTVVAIGQTIDVTYVCQINFGAYTAPIS